MLTKREIKYAASIAVVLVLIVIYFTTVKERMTDQELEKTLSRVMFIGPDVLPEYKPNWVIHNIRYLKGVSDEDKIKLKDMYVDYLKKNPKWDGMSGNPHIRYSTTGRIYS